MFYQSVCMNPLWGKNGYIIKCGIFSACLSHFSFTFFGVYSSEYIQYLHRFASFQSRYLALCQDVDFRSYCTFVRMLIVVALLLCHLQGCTLWSVTVQPLTSHLLILTSPQPGCFPCCWSSPARHKQPKSHHLRSKQKAGVRKKNSIWIGK